jgi:SP family sugar:H+ symporter-like MFS transporter
LTTTNALESGDEPPRVGYVILIAANLYVFAFGFSWAPAVWVLLGEMFPNKIRAAALSLAAALQWIANFLVSNSFPPITINLGLRFAYGLYSLFAWVSIFFVYVLVRETKGRELEDMSVPLVTTGVHLLKKYGPKRQIRTNPSAGRA